MNQKLSYSITSLTPPEINEKFLKAKRAFDSFFPHMKKEQDHYFLKNMAHVTLKRMFYLREGIRDEEVRSALASVTFQPLSVQAEDLDIFVSQKHGNVLVVKVRKTPELQKLHDELSDLVDTCSDEQDRAFERADFHPHLSMLYNLQENHYEQAKAYAREYILPISYTMRSYMFMRDVPGVVGERELVKEYFTL